MPIVETIHKTWQVIATPRHGWGESIETCETEAEAREQAAYYRENYASMDTTFAVVYAPEEVYAYEWEGGYDD